MDEKVKIRKLEGKRFAFWCPGCKEAHIVNESWGFNYDYIDKPTFTPSILVNRGRANPNAEICHSFVTNGAIRFLNDCTHDLAGKEIELPYWPEDVIEIN